jgi:2-oxoglutarate dehydrogenase complex dehydrogenase (E1) component-like enzyme
MPIRYIGRRDSGTTAEGSTKAHIAEQSRIVGEAVNPGAGSGKSGAKK